MKTRIIIVLLLVIMTHQVYAQYFPVDTARLNNAYRELVKEPQSVAAQRNFFDAFPDTWEKFIMTYQCIPDKEYDLTMFFNATPHINALYNLNTIPDSIYCRKLIHVSIGGRLNQDVAHDFWGLRILLKWVMKNKMETMFAVLSELRKGHQFEFWAFYWSNVHYRREINKEFDLMKMQNEKIHPREVEIMNDAYKYFHNGVNYVGNGFEAPDPYSQE